MEALSLTSNGRTPARPCGSGCPGGAGTTTVAVVVLGEGKPAAGLPRFGCRGAARLVVALVSVRGLPIVGVSV